MTRIYFWRETRASKARRLNHVYKSMKLSVKITLRRFVGNANLWHGHKCCVFGFVVDYIYHRQSLFHTLSLLDKPRWWLVSYPRPLGGKTSKTSCRIYCTLPLWSIESIKVRRVYSAYWLHHVSTNAFVIVWFTQLYSSTKYVQQYCLIFL